MKKPNFSHLYQLAKKSFSAMVITTATTLVLLLVRRDIVGEGVIALIFLLPVVWAAYHWGLGAGMSAALTAALTFDFLFIPPYYTFTIGNLEGWLIFIIFFAVAIIVVERIQSTLSKAHASEQETVMMYEFSTLLASLRSQEAIACSVARFIHQRFMAALVSIFIQLKGQAERTVAHEPQNVELTTKPDCVLPILNCWGLVGEIKIWRGSEIELPSAESRLFRNLALQVGLAIERVQITEFEVQQIATHEAVIR